MAPKKATKNSGVEKKKKAKDPNAPKRPLSAFFFFSNDMRDKVKSENPDIKFAEVGKKIGAMWNELSSEDKVPYEKKAEADKARYEKEKAAYVPKE